MFLYINGRRVWVELQAADGGGNDGGGEDKVLPADVIKSFENLLKKHGDNSNALAIHLYDENKTLRDQKRELERKVIPDGALVLSGTDALLWASYTALGKPDELKTQLDERTQLQGKLAAQERETLLRTVADVAYPGKATVLAQLDRMAKAEGHPLSYDVRDVTVDGKQTKVAYVKDGDKDTPLTEYAQTNWADFMPALTPAQGNGTQQAAGTRYLAQHAGGGGENKQTTKTVAQNTLDKAYAKREAK